MFINSSLLIRSQSSDAWSSWETLYRAKTLYDNSSGTTGIMDPLLHGGYGLCYIVITFIMLLAGLTDKFFRKRQYSIYSLMLLLIWGLCNSNISSLYDPVGLQQYLVSFISMYLAYIVNFKHSVKSLNNQ